MNFALKICKNPKIMEKYNDGESLSRCIQKRLEQTLE